MRIHEEAKHKGVRIDSNFCDYQTAYRKDLGKHIEKKNTQVGLPLLPGLVIFVISKVLDNDELKVHITKKGIRKSRRTHLLKMNRCNKFYIKNKVHLQKNVFLFKTMNFVEVKLWLWLASVNSMISLLSLL